MLTSDTRLSRRSFFADPGQGVVPLEEMIAVAGRTRNKRYVVERDSQVHPLTTARIGYEFLRSVDIKGSRR